VHKLNMKKMQNTPNLADPCTHGKRVRFDDERDGETGFRLTTRSGKAAEAGYESPRVTTLHPTKGLRTRNTDILARHGIFMQLLDQRRQMAGLI
jgi:hypothetical protein